MRDLIQLDQFDNSDFDRGASRFKEALWLITRSLFFMTSLPLPSSLRSWLLRRFGAVVGEGVVIRSRVNITFPWRVTIGDHVWIAEEVLILSLANVTIGSHVCISQRAFLCTGSHDFAQPTFDLITEPITVNDHSWIAAAAFIGPGVEVPAGTLVKAGSVNSKSTFSDSSTK